MKIQGSYTSCSCSRLVWCMHKTIKIIVEATSGDRLTAFYPRLGSWWLAERKAGGSRRDKEGKREGSSYPITLKTIVLSARGGPFWPAHPSHAFLKRGVALPPEHRGGPPVTMRNFDSLKVLPARKLQVTLGELNESCRRSLSRFPRPLPD